MKLTILSKENRTLLFKYCLVSIGSYVFIMSMMFMLVDVAKIKANLAFFLTYLMAYICEYMLNLKFLFLREHSWMKVLKFCVHIAIFIGLGSVVFSVFLKMHIHYLVATILSAAVLIPARFFAYKLVVFR